MIVHSTDLKTNLGHYLDELVNEDVFVLRNGKPVAKMVSYTYLTDSDLLKENAGAYDYKRTRISYEEFIGRYEQTDERMEYIDGTVYAMASPSYEHQKVVMAFSNKLYNYLSGKNCLVFASPFDVHFESSDSKACVQPDIFVICDKENVRNGKYYGIPGLVVEVMSHSTRSKDNIIKLNLYWREGVKEYLLADPVKQVLFYWIFQNNDIEEQGALGTGDTFYSRNFKGFEIDIRELFS